MVSFYSNLVGLAGIQISITNAVFPVGSICDALAAIRVRIGLPETSRLVHI